MKHMQIDINKIPQDPGIYIFKKKSWKILYIWKAKNLKNRLSQYFRISSVWKQDMLTKAEDIEYITTKTDEEAIILETNMIKTHKPPYNNLIKWEGSYTYIKITNEDFPRIYLTRYKENDKAFYIWPKQFKYELKKLIQLMKKYFQFRNCKQTEFKKWMPCWEYFFWICKWWCVYNKLKQKNADYYLKKSKDLGFKADMSKEKAKQEYKNSIKLIKKFFEGKTEILTNKILEDINEAIQEQNFERAAVLRDIYKNIEKFSQKQRIVIEEEITWYFFLIKKVGKYFVYILLYFFEGKIIDIIRGKENIYDNEMQELLVNIENELNGIKIYSTDQNKTIGFSKDLKNTKKSTIKQIQDQMEDYIQSYILSSYFNQDNLLNDVLKGIQERYFLEKFPHRIEFIDISHLSWGWVSGWLSCMIWGMLSKKKYRKYKIKASVNRKTYNNDYEAIEEIVLRRFWIYWENWLEENPDLFIIDWGKWQLGIIKKLQKNNKRFREKTKNVEFLSLEKWESRQRKAKVQNQKETIFYFWKNNEIKQKKMDYNEWDRFLIKLRDEAHRFANKYRKEQMKNEFKNFRK